MVLQSIVLRWIYAMVGSCAIDPVFIFYDSSVICLHGLPLVIAPLISCLRLERRG